MKRITKIVLIILIVFFTIPVFAKESISVESIKLVSQSENLNVTDTKNMNVSFNDLDQYVQYEVVLKNNTDKKMFVNELKVDNSSQDFIHYVLDDKSVGKEISSGKTTKVNIYVKTLEIEGAGRNTNDNINLKFMLGDTIKNPATGNNKVELILSIILVSLLIFICFYKKDTKVKVSIMVIALMLVGTTSVLADDVVTAELEGNVSYTSQNLMEESGTVIKQHVADYSNAKDVWKYYDKVKNVNISSVSKFEQEYEEEFDLTIGDKSRVKGYLVKSDAEDMYDLHIASRGVIYAPADSTALFSFPKVEKINGLENVVFEETKVFKGMFIGNEELKEVNVESIDFSNAEDTSYMFNNCNDLEISEDDLNIDNNTNTQYMFNKKLIEEIKVGAKSDRQGYISGQHKFIVNSSIEDENPIYYYRGYMLNNNVKFADYCWKIVRTTETGGIKLLLQGKNCSELFSGYSPREPILYSAYNSSYDSPAYAGYMYGTVYPVLTKSLTDSSVKYVYGNDVDWDGENYNLKTTRTLPWKDGRNDLLKGYHYTCFNTTGVCKDVYYINYFGDVDNAYYLTFSNGKKLEDAKNEMFENKTNSTIKTAVDNWYKENLINYTEYLEDTVWCNDRTIANGPLYSKDEHSDSSNVFSRSLQLIFRNDINFSLTCPNKNDRFTVDSKNGNGALTYPIGLLTADEMSYIAPVGVDSYLRPGSYQWSMTPSHFSTFRQSIIRTALRPSNGKEQIIEYELANSHIFVRPAISLKKGIEFSAGTGTVKDPYIIVE